MSAHQSPTVIAGLSDFITGDLTEWVVEVIDTIGYVGVASLVAVENVFPPIPSEVVLPAAGFAANQGEANFWLMVLAATVGSLVGAWTLYLVSAAIGPVRLHALTARYGKWLGVSAHDLDRAEDWFDEHSSVAVLVCRCVPLIRSLVSVPAGFRRMSPVKFTLYTAAGSLVWNLALVGAGYKLGDNWERVGDYVGVLQYVVIAVILAVVGWWIWTRFISASHKQKRAAQDAAAIAEFAADDAALDPDER
ncbi:MAG: DedA family protein [Acidimicrobiia bacterium]|nr:DedA family protein [Acidimicrobiia bacterium]